MRTLRLARAAAAAEGLRLRRKARQAAGRLVLLAIAAPFLLAGFGFLEAALWNALSARFSPVWAALITAGANLGLGLIVLLLALRGGGDDRIALEALAIRERALEGMTASLTVEALIVPLVRMAIKVVRQRKKPPPSEGA